MEVWFKKFILAHGFGVKAKNCILKAKNRKARRNGTK